MATPNSNIHTHTCIYAQTRNKYIYTRYLCVAALVMSFQNPKSQAPSSQKPGLAMARRALSESGLLEPLGAEALAQPLGYAGLPCLTGKGGSPFCMLFGVAVVAGAHKLYLRFVGASW